MTIWEFGKKINPYRPKYYQYFYVVTRELRIPEHNTFWMWRIMPDIEKVSKSK